MAQRAALSVWHLGLIGLVAFALWRNRRRETAIAAWLAVASVVVLAGCYMPFVASIGHNQYVLQTLPALAFAAAAMFANSNELRPAPDTDNQATHPPRMQPGNRHRSRGSRQSITTRL